MMVIIRPDELREMDAPTMAGRLRDVRAELHSELGIIAGGGRPKNSGRIKELKRTLARILTIARARGIDVEKAEKALLPPPPKREEKKAKEEREEGRKAGKAAGEERRGRGEAKARAGKTEGRKRERKEKTSA